MKKMILAAALVMASATAFAQDYAPAKGDISTEIQFNPFSNDFSTFKIDQLMARYMLTDVDGIRLGVGFGYDKDKKTPDPDNEDIEKYSQNKSSFFQISLGYERFLVKRNRVNIYVGGALKYRHEGASTYSYKHDDNMTSEETTYNKCGETRAANTFGLDAFTGIDFYVYQGLYVGAEFGFGIAKTTYPGWYTETKVTGLDTVTTDAQDKIDNINFATKCNASLRLGWRF